MTPEAKAAYLGPIVGACIQVGHDLPWIRQHIPDFLALLDLGEGEPVSAQPLADLLTNLDRAESEHAEAVPPSPADSAGAPGAPAAGGEQLRSPPAAALDPVAQRTERSTPNAEAAGSTPAGVAIDVEVPTQKPRGWWQGTGRRLLERCSAAGLTMRETAPLLRTTIGNIKLQASEIGVSFPKKRAPGGDRRSPHWQERFQHAVNRRCAACKRIFQTTIVDRETCDECFPIAGNPPKDFDKYSRRPRA